MVCRFELCNVGRLLLGKQFVQSIILSPTAQNVFEGKNNLQKQSGGVFVEGMLSIHE